MAVGSFYLSNSVREKSEMISFLVWFGFPEEKQQEHNNDPIWMYAAYSYK